MDTPQQQELEKFIHQQLRKLPEREAPENLIGNVLAAVAAKEALPWYKQPFTSWPRHTQAMLYCALAAVFGGAVLAAWRPAESVSLSALVERASSFAWLGRTLDAVANCLLVVLRALPWQLFAGVAVVIMVMYAACLATGFALYRINARTGSAAA